MYRELFWQAFWVTNGVLAALLVALGVLSFAFDLANAIAIRKV